MNPERSCLDSAVLTEKYDLRFPTQPEINTGWVPPEDHTNIAENFCIFHFRTYIIYALLTIRLLRVKLVDWTWFMSVIYTKITYNEISHTHILM